MRYFKVGKGDMNEYLLKNGEIHNTIGLPSKLKDKRNALVIACPIDEDMIKKCGSRVFSIRQDKFVKLTVGKVITSNGVVMDNEKFEAAYKKSSNFLEKTLQVIENKHKIKNQENKQEVTNKDNEVIRKNPTANPKAFDRNKYSKS